MDTAPSRLPSVRERFWSKLHGRDRHDTTSNLVLSGFPQTTCSDTSTTPGRIDNHGAVTRTPAGGYAYGNALGSMYRDKPNLIWSGGIDVNPDDPKRVSPMGMEG